MVMLEAPSERSPVNICTLPNSFYQILFFFSAVFFITKLTY